MPQEFLTLPPVYCAVGVYRLLTDPSIRKPVWGRCRDGLRRGAIVAFLWVLMTWKLQKAVVGYLLLNTPLYSGLSNDRVFGYRVPLDIRTYATVLFVGDQLTEIITFFLARNLEIARNRAWGRTMSSRGKPAEFWGRYVEEWEKPPHIKSKPPKIEKLVSENKAVNMIISAVSYALLNFTPVIGLGISAWMRALRTGQKLHSEYFKLKKMTATEVAVFVEERKWDYRAFGFVAALLESIPILGIGFTVSNRIASCMWAHDLEKRQELFRKGQLKPLAPRVVTLDNGKKVELPPARHAGPGFPLDLQKDKVVRAL